MTNKEIQERIDLLDSLDAVEKRVQEDGCDMTNEEIRERLNLANSLLEAEEQLAQI